MNERELRQLIGAVKHGKLSRRAFAQRGLAVAATRREKGADLPADLLIRESLRRLSGGR